MSPQKWTLLSTKDVSPSAWFPVESRTYRLPDGKIVEDFTVTTIADVAMIVPITTDKKIVLVKQFKPGFGDLIIEFPAGRIESKHSDMLNVAKEELKEETGIDTDDVVYFATIAGFVTKGTEKVYCYLANGVTFNSRQDLDQNEDIEIVQYTFSEFEELIRSNKIQAADTIAAWYIAKNTFPAIFGA